MGCWNFSANSEIDITQEKWDEIFKKKDNEIKTRNYKDLRERSKKENELKKLDTFLTED